MALADVEKPERTARALAPPHLGEIGMAQKAGDGVRDRLEQIARLAPVTARSKHKCLIALSGNHFLVCMIARENIIERSQCACVTRLQGGAGMFFYKAAEPFPQLARLSGDAVKLGDGQGCIQVHVEPFSQPVQIGGTIVQPVDRCPLRRHNRVEEIQCGMVGDKERIGSRFT